MHSASRIRTEPVGSFGRALTRAEWIPEGGSTRLRPAKTGEGLESRPELVLLDTGIPGMDGYEIASRLRSLPGAGKTVLAAMTGYGQEQDRRRSLEAGFDLHLVKPLQTATLLELLDLACTRPPVE